MNLNDPQSSAKFTTKKTLLWVLSVTTLALLMLAPNLEARKLKNSSQGTDNVDRTTELTYSAHPKFNLRVWVSTLHPNATDKYKIEMFDSRNRRVWNASNQRARTYSIGSNVTKIVIVRNERSNYGASTYWKK